MKTCIYTDYTTVARFNMYIYQTDMDMGVARLGTASSIN
jgi:hypothetical protein